MRRLQLVIAYYETQLCLCCCQAMQAQATTMEYLLLEHTGRQSLNNNVFNLDNGMIYLRFLKSRCCLNLL